MRTIEVTIDTDFGSPTYKEIIDMDSDYFKGEVNKALDEFVKEKVHVSWRPIEIRPIVKQIGRRMVSNHSTFDKVADDLKFNMSSMTVDEFKYLLDYVQKNTYNMPIG